MNRQKFAVITVSLEDREDGGIRISSDDLPGLVLSSSDRRQAIEAIIPAMTALLDRLGFKDFSIHPSKSVPEIFAGGNPQEVDVHVQQFVVEYRQAA